MLGQEEAGFKFQWKCEYLALRWVDSLSKESYEISMKTIMKPSIRDCLVMPNKKIEKKTV
jgi:hypothetical protein